MSCTVTRAVAALAFLLPAVLSEDVAKQVVNTPWWPPGTEKKVESVGIISHGFVYMTAMMEYNDTLWTTAEAELSDVQDIAQAAGADLEDLVDCLVNAPPGQAGAVRRATEKALEQAGAAPSLTVVELPGEIAFLNTSTSCVASLPSPTVRRSALRTLHGSGVAVRGLLHLTANGEGNNMTAAVAAVEELILKAGGTGLEDLAECTAFLQDLEANSMALRRALQTAGARPALTLLEAGLEDPSRGVTLRCVAAVASSKDAPEAPALIRTSSGAVVAHGFVYAPGVHGEATNGTDTFTALADALAGSGAGLADVVGCHFFVKDQQKVFDLFAGFYEVFNVRHPPPPTRDEMQAASECAKCAVLARCVAALPSPVALLV